jgi:hypothetical protein
MPRSSAQPLDDPVAPLAPISNNMVTYHDLTKSQKRALRAAAQLAHDRDRTMSAEDREVHYLEARNADLPIVVGGAVANGIIDADDVEAAARDLVADLAERIRAVSDADVVKPGETVDEDDDEEEDEDPNAAVSVAAIVREADAVWEECTLFVNRRTGAVTITRSEDIDGELEEDDEEDADCLQEAKAEGRQLESNPDWCALLDQYSLDEYGVMKRFARNAMPAASRDLFDALSGRSAFRRFRDVIHDRGLQEEWEAFRAKRVTDLVRFLLKEKGIPFRK